MPDRENIWPLFTYVYIHGGYMRIFACLILLLSLGASGAVAEDLSQDPVVRQYVKELPRGLNQYTEFGHFFEELVAIDLKKKYPSSRYEIIQGIEYLDGPRHRRNQYDYRPGDSRPYGELDVAVLDKKTNKFVEVGEVKCYRDMDAALLKAHEQLDRFKLQKSRGKIRDFLVLDDPKRAIKASQFDSAKYTTYGPKGAVRYGFTNEIKLSKYETSWIYNNHVKNKTYGFKAKRKSASKKLKSFKKNTGLNKAKKRIKHDVARGGLIADVAITAGIRIADKMGSGGSFKEGAAAAWDYISSPVFFAGDLLGGCLGAAIGSMIPIPAGLAAQGLLGSMVSSFPTMAGAMILANLGANAVSLLQRGEFTWKGLFKSVDWPVMSGQILGSVVGAALGSLIPIPYVGTVLGGIVGGLLGGKLAGALFPKSAAAEAEAEAEAFEKAAKANVDSMAQPQSPASSLSVSQLSLQVRAAYEAVLEAKTTSERAQALEEFKRLRKALAAARKEAVSSN